MRSNANLYTCNANVFLCDSHTQPCCCPKLSGARARAGGAGGEGPQGSRKGDRVAAG
jgi:hypothetical protein